MPDAPDLTAHPWFFCGIGGSGMLPLALILRGLGAEVAGSDRARDQGRMPEKFGWLEGQGIRLFPQDGSGIGSPNQALIASAAIEDSVPEVARAKALGCARLSRAELLAQLFNSAQQNIGIAGTSGKSTVTGMIGWILTEAGRDPTIMNGAVMKNFAGPDRPFASARVGAGPISSGVFVSEVDESDGSIALYRPSVAVLNNISLDHKSIEELNVLFSNFAEKAEVVVVNADDSVGAVGASARRCIRFGLVAADADIGVVPDSIAETPAGISATVGDRLSGETARLALAIPGRHNLANALAAIAAARAVDVSLTSAVAALAGFKGLARRFDVIGTSVSGITVIDDFAHNPDKMAATLATLRAHPGPIIAFFQPHGYGPLRQMGRELAASFAAGLGSADRLILCDPVYFGGTVDRSQGSERIIEMVQAAAGGPQAEYIAARQDCGARIATLARPGDRIIIMGARDDTLSQFAKDLLAVLR